MLGAAGGTCRFGADYGDSAYPYTEEVSDNEALYGCARGTERQRVYSGS